MQLRELIEKHGFTMDDYDKTIDELVKNGVGKGCFQDYKLLSFVIDTVIYDLEREAGK